MLLVLDLLPLSPGAPGRNAGFAPCGPFAGHQPSENNPFKTLELSARATVVTGEQIESERRVSMSGARYDGAPISQLWRGRGVVRSLMWRCGRALAP